VDEDLDQITLPSRCTHRSSSLDGVYATATRAAVGLTGHLAQVVDNADSIIVDHTVERGNPADAPQPGWPRGGLPVKTVDPPDR
jgi:hypothetical protein